MNLMLVAVAAVSIAIGEVPTAIVVAVLVVLNIVLGTRQELKHGPASTPSPRCRRPKHGSFVTGT